MNKFFKKKSIVSLIFWWKEESKPVGIGIDDVRPIPRTEASRSQILILGRTKSLAYANRLERTCTMVE